MTPIKLLTKAQQNALSALLVDVQKQRHRRLVWLSGGHQECLDYALEISRYLDNKPLWITDHPPVGVKHRGTHQAAGLMGRNIPTLIFDAHRRFDPDAFAQGCGAINGGELAILLTPDALDWPDEPDLDKARIAVHPYTAEQIGSRFIRRLILQLALDRQVLRWSCNQEWEYSPFTRAAPIPVKPADSSSTWLTDDQQTAVEAITSVVIGHRRRPAVLIADRGRGKSAAMGVAAANLLAVRCDHIVVTAPRKSAADTLFSHAETSLKEQGQVIGTQLQFIAPDELIETPVKCDLLLVDEAAGLPIHLLEQLLHRYSRIAFSTTVHGYEGSGRGFLLRFNQHLNQAAPGWKQITLKQPIRYAEGDPLEQTIFQSLLLNAAVDPRSCPETIDIGELEITRINRDELIHDETQLHAIYGLLVMAHYRTRPIDLRLLLDGPNIRVWSVTWKDRVIAAALVSREGDFSADLAAKIFIGERRPRGHLLAQTLIGHLGIENAAAMEGERIMRIVVHPEWQGRGIGQALVSSVRERAMSEGLQWCGASFGATPELLRFWGHCEMQPVYVGSRRETSSGAHSVMVLCALDEVGAELQIDAVASLQTRLPHWLAEQLRSLEVSIISEIYSQLTLTSQGANLPPAKIDNREWRAFAERTRSYDETLPALVEHFTAALNTGLATDRLTEAELQPLMMKLLQKRSWKAVAHSTGLTGRDQIISRMRKACRILSQR